MITTTYWLSLAVLKMAMNLVPKNNANMTSANHTEVRSLTWGSQSDKIKVCSIAAFF